MVSFPPLAVRLLRSASVLATALALGAPASDAQGRYRIQSGDQLTVEVMEDTSLNRTLLVLPGGSIDFPMVGTVQAGGRTVGQVRQALITALAPNFAVAPTVFVSVAALRPEEPVLPRTPVEPDTIAAFITGEVNSPGRFDVEPGTTILQIVAQAGGLTRFAAESRIELRRADPSSGRMSKFLFSYNGRGKGDRIPGGTMLADGDVVVVPERRLFE